MRRKEEARGKPYARAAVAVLGLGGTLLFAAVVMVATAARSEAAYPFALTSAPPRVLHWPVGRPVRVFLAADDAAGAWARRLAHAFRAAAADWETAAAGRIRFTTTARITEADVVVAWAGARLPVETGGCDPLPARVAVTTFCADEDWARLRPFPLRPPHAGAASSVRMLVTLRPGAAGTMARARQVLAHELGHALGIARHSPRPGDLMWGGRLRTVGPTPADRATLRALYGAEPDIVP